MILNDSEAVRLEMMEKGVLGILEAAQARYPPESNVHAACMRLVENIGADV